MPKCPKGKLVNPKTGRCVKRDGVLGKKILSERKKSPTHKSSAKAPKRKSSPKTPKRKTPTRAPRKEVKEYRYHIPIGLKVDGKVYRGDVRNLVSAGRFRKFYERLVKDKVKYIRTPSGRRPYAVNVLYKWGSFANSDPYDYSSILIVFKVTGGKPDESDLKDFVSAMANPDDSGNHTLKTNKGQAVLVMDKPVRA